MPHSALPDSDESSHRPESGAQLPGLTEALRRAVTELDASAVGVTRAAGGPPKYFTRSALAAQFFEDICAAGLESLKAQTQAKDGVFGTNRVRADSSGPVRGRLIALSLRSDRGLPLGILIAVRLMEEAKFGSRESQKLLALAKEFTALLTPQRTPLPPPSSAPPVSKAPPAAPIAPPAVATAPVVPTTSTVTPARSMWPMPPAPKAFAPPEDNPPITFEIDPAAAPRSACNRLRGAAPSDRSADSGARDASRAAVRARRQCAFGARGLPRTYLH